MELDERRRFEFVKNRDGLAAAIEFERGVVRAYRAAVLDPVRYGMYKRKLATLYCQAKRILREEKAHGFYA